MLSPIEKQKLELLDGSRSPGSKQKAAVRRGDMGALLLITPMTATELTASPTASDYNKLLADVTALYQALSQIAGNIKP